ncbi:MAG: hypothetical protein KL785_06425 [Brevundimonas sp.]|nr:hypothetical protein [Brevundimonas sp.]
MFKRLVPPLAVGLAMAVPAAAQTPPVQTPAPVVGPAPHPEQTFPVGRDVLSVDGEPLGVLARVEARPGGEWILHIRRTDGSMTTAPAVMASRGERAVVLEWTRAEFEAGAAMVQASPPEAAASAGPTPPDL